MSEHNTAAADGTDRQRSSSGTWGEQGHAGDQVDIKAATEAFNDLNRQYTHTSARSPSRSPKSYRKRLPSEGDVERGHAKPPPSTSSEETKRGDASGAHTPPKQLEGAEQIEDFDLRQAVQNRRAVYEENGLFFEKNLPVVWKDVSVRGVASSTRFVKDLPHAIAGTIFGTDFFNIVTGFVPSIKKILPGAKVQERTLLHGFTGMIRDEMLLVLGRPGSGCSTFLRLVANQRSGFSGIDGDVTYGGLSAEETAKKFRGEITYNPEDDLHFPTLTVEQTLRFAIKNKIPQRLPANESKQSFSDQFLTTLLKMFSISHTRNTIVGNPFIIGISGGERKRVSIAETLVTKSAITCWDNSTRGLDSASALQYGRSLRVLTDTINRGTVVTLYQMSESLYNLFDKTLLIDEGRCIFFGRSQDAKAYFDRLGYHQTDGQTTADFLTSITDPQEVRFKEGMEKDVPKSAIAREKAWKESAEYAAVLKEIEDYEKERAADQGAATKEFKRIVRSEKSKAQPKSSIYTISLPASIWALTQRQVLLALGDMQALYTKTFTNISIALIVSSMFYGQEETTAGAFTRGGVLFFSCLFLAWLNLVEIYGAMSGRPIIQRHKGYAFYRPAAVSVARVLADLPFTAFQVTVFAIVVYFLSSLRYDAGAFFIYYIYVMTSCFAVTSLYRAVASVSASFDTAIRFSVMYLTFAVVFAGYIIPRRDMPNYFQWISWVQPVSYAFEGLMANEFSALSLRCAPAQIVPNIPGADPAFQACGFQGAQPGSLVVDGNDYIRVAFGYYRSHLWPNFGYMWAFFAVYLAVDMLMSELLSFVPDGAAALVFARTKHAKQVAAKRAAAERQDEEEKHGYDGGKGAEKALSRGSIVDEHKPNPPKGCEERPIFTWKNLKYFVPGGPDGKIQLLRSVSGWVKPGEVTALMGASGAGKTTLLNTLAGRNPPFMTEGEILVDGKELTKGFKREAGFAEQQDIHETSATVREALEFAALLRQPPENTREEKLAHVERILDLLDLRYLEDAVIGEPGAGLTVEQRKRVTIGVELAAKPGLLMFLDEPTSGLDSSGAYQVGTFLRRLANDGQTVLCTIHQPSALLFTTFFDRLLLLQPGGRTAYFGPVKDIVAYFEGNGARHYEHHENVAEYILEIVGSVALKGKGSWADIWESSPEFRAMHQHIDEIVDTRKPRPPLTDPSKEREYAATLGEQIKLLTVRMARNFWRDASYGYGKLWVCVILGLMNGFVFFKVGKGTVNVAQAQQIMFSVFLVLLSVPAFANASIVKHFTLKALWQAREGPSKTYSAMAFVTALLINEAPYALVCALVYWVCWYWPAGLPTGEAAGYTFLATILYFLFLSPWIHWLCSLALSPTLVANVLPFFLVVLTLMNGVIVPWAQMPVIWKFFVYFSNPNTYLIRGQVAQVLHNVPITCADSELAVFNPPSGQTCGAYAGDFLAQQQGMIYNPDATSGCQACLYTVGDQYTSQINGDYSHSWYEDFVIYLVFTITNVFLVYGLFYWAQVMGGAFIIDALPGMLLGFVLAPFKKVYGLLRRSKAEPKAAEEAS